jgi:HTH-type transcriptional regulator, competence development regulator
MHAKGDSRMTFGQRIRELRKQQRLTQRVLAESARVDFTYLSKIENDRLDHAPSIKVIQGLARVLGIDELELMALANRVPPGLDAIARNKDATRFFRRATQVVKTSQGWRDLLDYIDRRVRTKRRVDEP